MKKPFLLFLILLSFIGCLTAQQTPPALVISHLTDNFYVYTTYRNLDGKPFPSNSMYLVADDAVVMFDTPWDSTQLGPLMDSIEQRHHKPVILCVVTHFHADRTAGLDFLRSRGVATYSSRQTDDLCVARNEKRARFVFTEDTLFKVKGCWFRTFYAGAGHSRDNLVIWFPDYKILYGGCLVRSTESNSLGNLEDANMGAWRETLKKIMKEFGEPEYVIPGHFGWGNKHAIKHTLKLLRQHKPGDD